MACLGSQLVNSPKPGFSSGQVIFSGQASHLAPLSMGTLLEDVSPFPCVPTLTLTHSFSLS